MGLLTPDSLAVDAAATIGSPRTLWTFATQGALSAAPGVSEARTAFNAAGGAAPAFGTDWENYGSGYETFGFFRWGPLVVVSGLVKRVSGAGTAIATLPVGYRPAAGKIFTGNGGGAFGRFDISAVTGIITWVAGTATSYYGIDVVFKAA